MIAYSLFRSLAHLEAACRTLDVNCVRGITANRERLRASVENSIGIVTALNPYIGYRNATAVAMEAHATGGGLRPRAREAIDGPGPARQGAPADRLTRPQALTAI